MSDSVEDWISEEIPDDALLYLRVHKNNVDRQGLPNPGAFLNNPKLDPNAGMSTDWNKYSIPAHTRCAPRKDPSEYAVVALLVSDVREIASQRIEHTPIREYPRNRAHTDVFGDKDDQEVRDAYSRIGRNYVIRLGDPVTHRRPLPDEGTPPPS